MRCARKRAQMYYGRNSIPSSPKYVIVNHMRAKFTACMAAASCQLHGLLLQASCMQVPACPAASMQLNNHVPGDTRAQLLFNYLPVYRQKRKRSLVLAINIAYNTSHSVQHSDYSQRLTQ